jgi:hypothetical protein
MSTETARDVMQVCLGGHVITDVLATHPEQGMGHCDRCGSPTISRCPTCGDDIPGSTAAFGLMPIGRRHPPAHCPNCGVAFPWAERPVSTAPPDTLAVLEPLLRRLPQAVRQLRDRHDRRPTLRVEDEYDLEDLLRTVFHLNFDDVRRESRTPSYSPTVRTDFIVGPQRTAVSAKLVKSNGCEPALVREVREDVAYYEQAECGGLVVLVYDPEQLLPDPRRMEVALGATNVLNVCCVVAS